VGVGVAQAEVKGYGLLDLAYGTNFGEKQDGDAGFGGGGNSGNRFGVKGDADVVSGLKLTFNAEAGFSPIDTDNGETGIVTNDDNSRTRQAWMGLSGSFGEVRYGKQDAALLHTFMPLEYNGASNTATTALAWTQLSFSVPETLQYFSPELGPLSFRVSYTSARTAGDGAADADPVTAAGLTFVQGPITVAMGYQTAATSDADDYAGAEVQYALGEGSKIKAGYHTIGDASQITLGGVTALGGINVGAAYSVYDSGVDGADTVGSYEVFVNKELVKNLIGYAEIGGSDLKDDPTTDPKDESAMKYAIGVIYLF